MLLLSSSLPAQAASATGSSRIATHFADIPKCNPFFKKSDARAVLDRPPEKWNSHLGYRADVPGLLRNSSGPHRAHDPPKHRSEERRVGKECRSRWAACD